jgi:hypothetical protein
MTLAEPEPLISREEAAATMFNVADIASDVRSSGDCSRRTVKRKRSKKEIADQARREAESSPNIRRLRELARRAWAELRAQGRVEGPPPAPGEGAERLREVVLRREARRRADNAPSSR